MTPSHRHSVALLELLGHAQEWAKWDEIKARPPRWLWFHLPAVYVRWKPTPVNVTQFLTTCLGYLEWVEASKNTVTVLDRKTTLTISPRDTASCDGVSSSGNHQRQQRYQRYHQGYVWKKPSRWDDGWKKYHQHRRRILFGCKSYPSQESISNQAM